MSESFRLVDSEGSLKYLSALSLSFSGVRSSVLVQAPSGPRLVHIYVFFASQCRYFDGRIEKVKMVRVSVPMQGTMKKQIA